jgi:hypothetical protein
MNPVIMTMLGFKEEMDTIAQGKCPFCEKEITEFRDELSKKEWEISGLCQLCQDKTFGG